MFGVGTFMSPRASASAEALPPPSSLTYSSNPGSYTRNTAITANAPTVTGTVDSYSVSPALPTGLSLDTTTGIITGTPSVTTASAVYTVTATNASGETTCDVTISVAAASAAIVWSTVSSGTDLGNGGFQKTANAGWADGHGASTQSFNGSMTVQGKAANTNKDVMLGLSVNSLANPVYGAAGHGDYLLSIEGDTKVRVYELGVGVFPTGVAYTTSDVFAVKRTGDDIEYFKNGVSFFGPRVGVAAGKTLKPVVGGEDVAVLISESQVIY